MNDNTSQDFLPRRQRLTPGIRMVLAVGFLSLLLGLLGETGREWLRFQRDALLGNQHEYWRLLTGHLVHGSWQHTWLNLAGLALMVALFRDGYRIWQWTLITLVSAVSIDIGLLYYMPQLQWYVGLSGVLHGVLAAGALLWWRFEPRPMAMALTAILIGKLGWEQWQGALPLSGDLNVIVNAHLYGALGGLLSGALLMTRSAQGLTGKT